MLSAIDNTIGHAGPITLGHFSKRRLRAKRIADVVLSLLALVVLAPGLLLIAGALLIADGRPVIYRHTRIGKHGRTFECLKFRSMRKDAAERLEQLLASDPEIRREWMESQKLRHDPRIHRLGHFLRVSSLDELPQLINVIRGEMSLVGPRPIVTDEMARYGDQLHYYLAMTPGVTGLWQVCGRNDTSYEARVLFDVEYYHKRSTRLDLMIMIKTVGVLLFARNGW